MQLLFQSAFLQALGRAILDSIWQMLLLFLLYHFILWLGRIKSATVKNFLSTVAVFTGFIVFLISFVRYYISSTTMLSLVIEQNGDHNQMLSNFALNQQWKLLLNWMEYKLNLVIPYLSVAYLFILSWFVFRLAMEMRLAKMLRHRGIQSVSEDLNDFFEYLVQQVGVEKKVLLYLSSKVDIPSTLGFFKPLVLLPVAAINHLSPAQLEAVLLHELAHIKRNDYFWNIGLTITETILFFNPFAQLLINTARKERENSCDDMVMQLQQNAPVYAEALLNVEKARLIQPRIVMALGQPQQHLLAYRIKRILNVPVEKNKISNRILALVLVTILFGLTGWLVKHKQKETSGTNATNKTVLTSHSGTFLIQPDIALQQNKQAITLRDQKRKMQLEIKKSITDQNFIVTSDDMEKEVTVDKIFFKELPPEWLESFLTGEHPSPPPPPPSSATYQDPGTMMKWHFDSAQKKYKEWMAKTNEVQNRKRMAIEQRMYNRPGQQHSDYRYFFKKERTDSLLSKIKEFTPDQFIGFVEEPFYPVFEYPEYTAGQNKKQSDSMKDQQQRFHKKQMLFKFKQDSLRRKLNDRLQNLPYIAFNEMKLPVLPPDGQAMELIIENDHVLINGVPVQTMRPQTPPRTDTRVQENQPQQQPSQPTRRIKHIEIIRL